MSGCITNTKTQNALPLPDGYKLYKKMGCPRYICAPMVAQSELAFRVLCRGYGVDLCYSPMINSRHYVLHPKRRLGAFKTIHTFYENECKEERETESVHNNNTHNHLNEHKNRIVDRPLIAQICGNDPSYVLQCSQLLAPFCDAIDLNFGCPQNIAKKGNYGAFLLTQPTIMCSVIRILHEQLTIPVTCKIRILETEQQTLELVKMLCDSGISLLTIHGRTIAEKKQKMHECNWNIIKHIKALLVNPDNDYNNIPVFANGGCETLAEVEQCLNFTKCDGYMAAEPLLSNPSMFLNLKTPLSNIDIDIDIDIGIDSNSNTSSHCNQHHIDRSIQITRTYLQITQRYDENICVLRGHLHKMLHRELSIFTNVRKFIGIYDKHWLQTELIPLIVDKIAILNEYNRDCKLFDDVLYPLTRNWYHRHWKTAEQDSNKSTLESITVEFEGMPVHHYHECNCIESDIPKLLCLLITHGIINECNCVHNIGTQAYKQCVLELERTVDGDRNHNEQQEMCSDLEMGRKINLMFDESDSDGSDSQTETDSDATNIVATSDQEYDSFVCAID